MVRLPPHRCGTVREALIKPSRTKPEGLRPSGPARYAPSNVVRGEPIFPKMVQGEYFRGERESIRVDVRVVWVVHFLLWGEPGLRCFGGCGLFLQAVKAYLFKTAAVSRGRLGDEENFAVGMLVFGEVLGFARFFQAKCFCDGDGEFSPGYVFG